uniref:Uncharacterized protein n=1 Tax=Arundo donax TaxID=35708 RepID=A0A0A9QL57_ARUDO
MTSGVTFGQSQLDSSNYRNGYFLFLTSF